jgi:hypothetical protein
MRPVRHRLAASASFVAAALVGTIALADPHAGGPGGPGGRGGGPSCPPTPTPVGLSLFFENGVIQPIQLVGDSPRFLQEIDITAEVTTTTDQGVQPLIDSGALGNLDWRGIHYLEDRWTQPGDGTWTRERFYRGANWMIAPNEFFAIPLDDHGHQVGDPIPFDAGVDDHWNPQQDDNFVRRFNVRQTTVGCQAYEDCSNVSSFVVEGLVQSRQEQFPDQSARPVPESASRLELVWSSDPWTKRVVPITHAPASAYPFGYGFLPTIEVVNPPANGKYYHPGDELSIRIAFYDEDGNQLNTPGSLPTYEQANVLNDQAPGAAGIRYWDPTIDAVRYYALKHREANMLVTISGPTNLVREPKTTVPGEDLFLPQTIATTVANDGFSSTVIFVPPIGEILGPPSGWTAPTSDVQTLNVPSDALPGTYTLSIKARRDWAGEALNRSDVITIQVGQTQPTTWTPTTGNCESCHSGRSSLSIVNHGLSDRTACFGCHMPLSFEPDNALDDRIHGIHSRSQRFPADFNKCSTCHLSPPTGPAVGQYAGPPIDPSWFPGH